MRKWGMVVTAFYAVIIMLLVVPVTGLIVADEVKDNLFANTLEVWRDWHGWLPIAILITSQGLLLFLSVDTSFRKLRPRAHILVSSVFTAALTTLLVGAAALSLGAGVYGDHFGAGLFNNNRNFLASWAVLWLLWAVIFYLYFRNSNPSITRITTWLLRGSVLELLIAVPSHIIARRRHDCSAPIVTGFGIATGISIMFLCFGPSVLFLYKKRLSDYKQRKAAAG